MTDRNIEAMEFVLELVSKGIIDPAAVSYTTDNLSAQWKTRKVGLGCPQVPSCSASATPRGRPRGGQPDRRPARRQGDAATS